MGKGVGTIIAAGLVTIGLATAVFLPGRQTIGVVKAGGNAGQGLLSTAITGKNS